MHWGTLLLQYKFCTRESRVLVHFYLTPDTCCPSKRDDLWPEKSSIRTMTDARRTRFNPFGQSMVSTMNVRASHDTRGCDSRNIAQRSSQTSRQGFFSSALFFARQHFFVSISANQHNGFPSAYFFSISAHSILVSIFCQHFSISAFQHFSRYAVMHMSTPVAQYSEYRHDRKRLQKI